MESLITTIVFVLPGFLMYFWIQAFGLNPVSKHSAAETAAISGLLWLPVSCITLLIMSLYSTPITTLKDIEEASSNLFFMAQFSVISIVVSFICSLLYVWGGYPLQRLVTNQIRKKRNLANLSDSSSVWEEAFHKRNKQVVGVGKIDSDKLIIGCIRKVSRAFEADRNLFLEDVDFFTKLVIDYNIPVSHSFVDTRTGNIIKIYDIEKIMDAQIKQLSSNPEQD